MKKIDTFYFWLVLIAFIAGSLVEYLWLKAQIRQDAIKAHVAIYKLNSPESSSTTFTWLTPTNNH